ncbi:MAG: sterol desaturase family protein, partial [Bacteroidota bacterium]|nr:sterol desaturase family protein [Bacteroidota bacterium]
VYGLVSNIQKPNAVNLVFHEWQNIKNDVKRKDIGWREKLKYTLKAPGWSHDGSRFTSKQLRQKGTESERG